MRPRSLSGAGNGIAIALPPPLLCDGLTSPVVSAACRLAGVENAIRQGTNHAPCNRKTDAARSSASLLRRRRRRINSRAERSQCNSGKSFKGGGRLSRFTEGRPELRQLPPIYSAECLQAGRRRHQSQWLVHDLVEGGLASKPLRLAAVARKNVARWPAEPRRGGKAS